MVVRAAPDGYTIGYGNIGGLAINPSILPKVPYDALKDMQPVAQTNSGRSLLAVTNALPVKSVRELIDYARAYPGKLLNALSGNGTPGHSGVKCSRRWRRWASCTCHPRAARRR